jgi:thiol-disulfide isomerase/thioredoxin
MSDRGREGWCTRSVVLWVVAAGALAGCAETTSPAGSSPAMDGVKLTPVDQAGFDAVLARLRGKVVLVDCWATWCLPCVEQLPHSIELAKQHGTEGLAVVTVSFDDSDAADQVRALLERIGGASSINLQSRFGGSTNSMDAFDVASGALPHYKLYDRQGNLHRTFDLDPAAKQQFTANDIDAAVMELLAE